MAQAQHLSAVRIILPINTQPVLHPSTFLLSSDLLPFSFLFLPFLSALLGARRAQQQYQSPGVPNMWYQSPGVPQYLAPPFSLEMVGFGVGQLQEPPSKLLEVFLSFLLFLPSSLLF